MHNEQERQNNTSFVTQFEQRRRQSQTTNKKPLVPQSNREKLESWLETVANILTDNTSDFNSIYSEVQKSIDTYDHNNEFFEPTCMIAQFGIDDKTMNIMFRSGTKMKSNLPIPSLTMREVQEELEKGKIEITVNKADNPFDGTRLRLKENWIGAWSQDGYRIVVDFSPKLESSCRVSKVCCVM